MRETVTLECVNDLQDVVNLIYRAGFYLSLGYGVSYYGPAIDVNEDGEEYEEENTLCLVLAMPDKKEVGICAKEDDDPKPLVPTILNPQITMETAQMLEPAIGTVGNEGLGDDEEEETDIAKFLQVLGKRKKTFVAKSKHKLFFKR